MGSSSDEESIDLSDIDHTYQPSEAESHILLSEAKDSSNSSENDMPLSEIAKSTGKKSKIPSYTWKREHFDHAKLPADDDFNTPTHILTPLEYFKKFFDDGIIEMISNQTNLYSTQASGVCVDTSHREIMTFLAIQLYMGVIVMASYKDYWSNAFRYDQIANIMSLKRYMKLRRYLHFHDNLSESTDRTAKIHPVFEKNCENCKSQDCENRCSIDELMIPYKSGKAGTLRQYVPNKPKRGDSNYLLEVESLEWSMIF